MLEVVKPALRLLGRCAPPAQARAALDEIGQKLEPFLAHAAGTQVVRWHRDANNVELVYGLFDERGGSGTKLRPSLSSQVRPVRRRRPARPLRMDELFLLLASFDEKWCPQKFKLDSLQSKSDWREIQL